MSQWGSAGAADSVAPGPGGAETGRARLGSGKAMGKSALTTQRPAAGKKNVVVRRRLELLAGVTGRQEYGRRREEPGRGIDPFAILPSAESTRAAITGGPCRVRKNVLTTPSGAGDSTPPSQARPEYSGRR